MASAAPPAAPSRVGTAEPTDLQIIVAAAETIPTTGYPGGWPDEIEAALIDAVLSIQARYGTPHTGVRAATARYRAGVGTVLDDLTRLATAEPAALADLLRNHQRTGGRLKAAAIVEAADNLVTAGVRHAAHLAPTDTRHRRAYVRVRGLGPITWDYLLMNLGHPGVKADTWILRWIHSTLHRPVNAAHARRLIIDAAEDLEVSPTTLDHAIWAHARDVLSRGHPSHGCPGSARNARHQNGKMARWVSGT